MTEKEENNRDSFGLRHIRDGLVERREELAHGGDKRVRSLERRPNSNRGEFSPRTLQKEDYDRTEAPKDDMRSYWRQFETTPIVRQPITSFASQVVEPGYYIQARGLDEDELRDLDHWLQKAAIIEGEVGVDFRKLAKKSVIQREVRGTALVEKAPSRDNPDEIAGLKLINPETMEVVTRPGQSILLAPDDNERDDLSDVPMAESGKGAAAYLQDLSETETLFGRPVNRVTQGDEEDYKIGFTRDEIIKLTRDADVGEVFGTARVEAVSDRIEGIKQKLSDNDEAIASKAYPLWLFLFGTPENPWETERIDEFMGAHEFENFHPGMKQGVRGDVDIDTISGEVADIADSLEFDLNWIISAMPMPKFALGAFQSSVGQVEGIAKQQDVNRQINEARRELEEEFTPVLREVAMNIGVDEDTAKDIYLKIGEPGEPETEVPQRENIIRYIPKDQRSPEPSDSDEGNGESGPDAGGNQPGDSQPIVGPDDGGQIVGDGIVDADEPQRESAGAQLWHVDTNFEELQFGEDEESELADEIFDILTDARNSVLDKVEQQYGQTPAFAATNMERLANRVIRDKMKRRRLRDRVEPAIEKTVMDVMEEFGEQSRHFSKSQNIRFYVQNVENSTEDAMEEMMRLVRTQVRRGAVNNEQWGSIRGRVEEKFNDANLRQRAELISHMELRNAVETTKLQQWESDPDIVGVRIVNPEASTPLTQSLHGAQAFFNQGNIRDQWMEQTRSEFLRKGFDPIPPTPPFHFNDTTTIEPIKRK